MDKLEKVTWRIWKSEGMGKALLIGGLLFYIPVINLLLLGYYGCWLRQLAQNQGLELPEWREGRRIVTELGRVIVPYLVYMAAPFILAGLLVWALAGLLSWMHLDLFAKTLAYLPLALVALLAPVAFTVSLLRLYKSGNLKDALALDEVVHSVIRHIRSCLFPLFQFYGILLLGWPLIGFAAFFAHLPLLAQLVLVLRPADADLKSAEI